MAVQLVFGKRICQCDHCLHVWMNRAKKLPARCMNAAKRCGNWNLKGTVKEGKK